MVFNRWRTNEFEADLAQACHSAAYIAMPADTERPCARSRQYDMAGFERNNPRPTPAGRGGRTISAVSAIAAAGPTTHSLGLSPKKWYLPSESVMADVPSCR